VQLLAASTNWDEDYARTHGIRRAERRELLAAGDIVSVHVPLSPATAGLLDERALARMKPSAILINTSRGGVVDDAALLRALQAGQLAGAGLDVFVSESDKTQQATTQALIALPNVVATPHAAASTREGLARTNRIAAESVVAVLDGRSPRPECIVADGRTAFSKVLA
jgi:D-3-phosphoglycerate dehydrogenase